MLFRRLVDSAIAKFGSWGLTLPPVRWLMNQSYNHGSQGYRRFFIRRFRTSRAYQPFKWAVAFHGKHWSIPVMRQPDHSWSVALSGLGVGEEILRCHRLFIENHRGPKVIFDVGANFGLISYPFLAHGYEAVLFEPQDLCASYIDQVARLNDFHPRIERCVLSSAPGELDFYTSDSTWFSSVSKTAVEVFESARKQTVPALTLDDYCAQSGTIPALVKIDVEGHELDVIRGGEKLFTTARPTIMVEIWAHQLTKAATFEFLRAAGYEAFGITSEKLIPITNVAAMNAFGDTDFIFCADEHLLSVWRHA